MDLGEAGRVPDLEVDLVLVKQLRTASSLSEFDGNVLPVGADAQVDVPEGAAADTLGDAVFGDGGLHCLYSPYSILGFKVDKHVVRLSLEVGFVRYPPKIEKNSKVGDFPLRNSYVEFVLKLKWCGWRDSFPRSSWGPFWGGYKGQKNPVC